jgi:hypothetical protein
MRKRLVIVSAAATLALSLLVANLALGQGTNQLAACGDFAFSTEEDFITQGPTPPDGNPLISDGDLLGPNHTVCARNAQLLSAFKPPADLGLDAVDVIDVERQLVAFSTELDDPGGAFTAGDLLTTHGAAIPNQALTFNLGVRGQDLGLDGIQVIGSLRTIVAFMDVARATGRAQYLKEPALLGQQLRQSGVDLWFTIEGTAQLPTGARILDGDILSARDGNVVIGQPDLLPGWIPAGIPQRGVDFGVDALAAPRSGERAQIRFSTEILHHGETSFNDGDILKQGDGIETPAQDLVAPFEPRAGFLGTDALHISFEQPQQYPSFLPLLLRLRRLLGLIP